jgi:hypothetical protein
VCCRHRCRWRHHTHWWHRPHGPCMAPGSSHHHGRHCCHQRLHGAPHTPRHSTSWVAMHRAHRGPHVWSSHCWVVQVLLLLLLMWHAMMGQASAQHACGGSACCCCWRRRHRHLLLLLRWWVLLRVRHLLLLRCWRQLGSWHSCCCCRCVLAAAAVLQLIECFFQRAECDAGYTRRRLSSSDCCLLHHHDCRGQLRSCAGHHRGRRDRSLHW